MTDDLHNLNDVMAELEGIAIKTSQGSFIKVEDARRLIEKKKQAGAIADETAPAPKTLEQARSQAKEYLGKLKLGPQGPQEPGRSVSASEAQSSSRT